MSNSIKSYEDFKKLTHDEQNYHIYDSLSCIPKQDDMDKRYSKKWVEKIIVWGGTVSGGVVIVYLVNSILK